MTSATTPSPQTSRHPKSTSRKALAPEGTTLSSFSSLCCRCSRWWWTRWCWPPCCGVTSGWCGGTTCTCTSSAPWWPTSSSECSRWYKFAFFVKNCVLYEPSVFCKPTAFELACWSEVSARGLFIKVKFLFCTNLL